MDGWSPDRKFRILGVVVVKPGTKFRLPGLLNELAQAGQSLESSPESHLASEAKAHGGDAVIIVQNGRKHDSAADPESGTGSGNDADEGGEFSQGKTSSKHRRAREAYIVKYAEGDN